MLLRASNDSGSSPQPHRLTELVLIVDDDTDLRQLTAMILSLNGYDVIEAEHGGDALIRLASSVPDLVILDLNMPIVDGWQFRAQQQGMRDSRLAAIPVVLLTGADRAAEHATALGASGLVRKPFDPKALLDAVGEALAH